MKYGVRTNFKTEERREFTTTVYKSVYYTLKAMGVECKLTYDDVDARIIHLEWDDENVREENILNVIIKMGV